jgi:hypothetical protein
MEKGEAMMKTFDEITFGIEIETCYHMFDIDNDLSISKAQKIFMTKMNEITDNLVENKIIEKEPYYTWVIDKGDETYDKWIVDMDGSVLCGKSKDSKCYIEKKIKPGAECMKLTFYPIEIITPKLQGSKGLEIFSNVFSRWIFSDNIAYITNYSQGIHINLSHPKMVFSNFIRLWQSIESILFHTLPIYRKTMSKSFFQPIENQEFKIPSKYAKER